MLEIIKKIAQEAGNILMKYYDEELDVDSKQQGSFDPVTIADRESDEYIRKRIQDEFPEDDLFSEENLKLPHDFIGRLWIIDPLDGTKKFLNKLDNFCVSIGLVVDQEPVFGVLYAPVYDEYYYAEKGKGAFYEKNGNKKRMNVTGLSEFEKARFLDSRDLDDEDEIYVVRENLGLELVPRFSSFALDVTELALGNCDVYVTPWNLGKWDTCAAQIILEEAGGTITDIEGNALKYDSGDKWGRSLVMSNGILHDELLRKSKNILERFSK